MTLPITSRIFSLLQMCSTVTEVKKCRHVTHMLAFKRIMHAYTVPFNVTELSSYTLQDLQSIKLKKKQLLV